MSVEYSEALDPLLASDLEELLRLEYLSGFGQEETLYAPGEVVDRFYLVCQGRLALLNDAGATVARLGPGEAYGAAALAAESPARARVVAETDCSVVALTREQAAWLRETQPGLAARLLWRLIVAVTAKTAPAEATPLPATPSRPPGGQMAQLARLVHETQEALADLG